MSAWFSIEVFDGATPASQWAEAYGDTLMETALSQGATDWSWHQHPWGVVLELCFPADADWEAFLELTFVRAALDAVPDPLTGVIVYRGRGGSSGASERRPRKPLAGAGAAALPIPWDAELERVASLADLAGPAVSRPLLVGVP